MGDYNGRPCNALVLTTQAKKISFWRRFADAGLGLCQNFIDKAGAETVAPSREEAHCLKKIFSKALLHVSVRRSLRRLNVQMRGREKFHDILHFHDAFEVNDIGDPELFRKRLELCLECAASDDVK